MMPFAEVARALDAARGELALLAHVDELEARRRAAMRAATSSVETSAMWARTVFAELQEPRGVIHPIA